MNSASTVSIPHNRVALTVVYRPVSALKPYSSNARTHSRHQIRQIADSFRVFGFNSPILIDRKNRIIAGHARLEAAILLGMDQVPTIQLEDLTEDQTRAYVIADNRLAENSAWDTSILAIELQHLLSLDCADFDITVTGFEIPEIDLILEESKRADQLEDPVPEPNLEEEAITQLGDRWILGKHQILCASALHESSYKTLMAARRASAVFTDPPFNVQIDGHATGNGNIRHREFAMASGEMSKVEFLSFLTNSLRLMAAYSGSNSVHYICMDWRHVADLIAAGEKVYDELLNLCVWAKDAAGLGSFYRSMHELILVFRKGKQSHRNNVQLGKFGRNRTNVWKYPGIQTLSKQSNEGNLLALHPTVKPVAMVADAILDCTARGEIVLDPFLGSGTTLMAAEQVGRVCYGIEIDPIYVDVAIRRWQNRTGERAVHAESKKSFNEIARLKAVKHA